MKNLDFESVIMGVIAGTVIVALIAFAVNPQQDTGPQGIIITSLEPVVIHSGRTVWYVDYILDGEVQPSVICATEEYARRLIAYLEEYRAAEWRGE